MTHEPIATLTADSFSDWFMLSPQGYGMQRFQLFASGDLGGGTLSIQGCLHTKFEDPNSDAPDDSEVFTFPSTEVTDLLAQDPPNFVTKSMWVRAQLAGSTSPAVSVWIL